MGWMDYGAMMSTFSSRVLPRFSPWDIRNDGNLKMPAQIPEEGCNKLSMSVMSILLDGKWHLFDKTYGKIVLRHILTGNRACQSGVPELDAT